MRLSTFYFFWFLMNSAILYASNYFQEAIQYLREFPIIQASWRVFFEKSDQFYMINNFDITSYDITEYAIALLLPLFVYHLIDHFKKPKYNKKFSFDD